MNKDVDLHAALLRHATEVVAQQIDDHQVLGPVLGRRQQARSGLPACQRALHRPRDQTIALLLQKQLRRERDDSAVGIAQESAVAHRLALAQPGVQGQWLAEPFKSQRKGEIGLVTVAGGNVVADAVDRGSVPFFIDCRGDAANPGRLFATLRRQPGVGRDGIHRDAPPEAPEAGQRPLRMR